MSPPFDTDALREWAELEPLAERAETVNLPRALWETLRADLLAAADEIEMLMLERTKEAAA